MCGRSETKTFSSAKTHIESLESGREHKFHYLFVSSQFIMKKNIKKFAAFFALLPHCMFVVGDDSVFFQHFRIFYAMAVTTTTKNNSNNLRCSIDCYMMFISYSSRLFAVLFLYSFFSFSIYCRHWVLMCRMVDIHTRIHTMFRTQHFFLFSFFSVRPSFIVGKNILVEFSKSENV